MGPSTFLCVYMKRCGRRLMWERDKRSPRWDQEKPSRILTFRPHQTRWVSDEKKQRSTVCEFRGHLHSFSRCLQAANGFGDGPFLKFRVFAFCSISSSPRFHGRLFRFIDFKGQILFPRFEARSLLPNPSSMSDPLDPLVHFPPLNPIRMKLSFLRAFLRPKGDMEPTFFSRLAS